MPLCRCSETHPRRYACVKQSHSPAHAYAAVWCAKPALGSRQNAIDLIPSFWVQASQEASAILTNTCRGWGTSQPMKATGKLEQSLCLECGLILQDAAADELFALENSVNCPQ